MKLKYLLLLFIVAMFGQASWAAPDYKQLGQSLCQQGRYAEAVPLLEKAVAQNRRSGALWYLAIARQHLYDFEGAIEAIEAYQPVLHSPEWQQRADSLLAVCQTGLRAFEHTLDVVIADSLLVPRRQFFEYYRLSSDAGRIVPSASGLGYENERGDHRIFPDGAGLAEQHRFQNVWDEVRPLAGLPSPAWRLQDPFLLSDGATLYFACDSMPGIGGLDIYRTTYDAEEERFYQPERLGMPFNSPYDDYMMAIDESHGVGWWATERNAVADSVMIYVFLLDNEEQWLDEPTVSRARIDRIADTWREAGGYAALLEELSQPQHAEQAAEQLHVVIGEGVVYNSLEQFRNRAALEAYQFSVRIEQQMAEAEQKLTSLRAEYQAADKGRKEALAKRIAEQEELLLSLVVLHGPLVKEYRRLEQESFK